MSLPASTSEASTPTASPSPVSPANVQSRSRDDTEEPPHKRSANIDDTTDRPLLLKQHSSTDTVSSKNSRNLVMSAKVQEYYDMLDEYIDHFARNDSALVWLARAVPSRSNKLAVPKSCRHPKSSSGQGGYAAAFKACQLSLRDTDTKSGHWHCWYYDSTATDLQALQTALKRRWKQNPNHNPEAANIVANLHLNNKQQRLAESQQLLQANVLPVSYIHYDNNQHVMHDRMLNPYYGAPHLYPQMPMQVGGPPQHAVQAVAGPSFASTYGAHMMQQQSLAQQQYMQVPQAQSPYMYQQVVMQPAQQQIQPQQMQQQPQLMQMQPVDGVSMPKPARQSSVESDVSGSVPFTPASKDANKVVPQFTPYNYTTQSTHSMYSNQMQPVSSANRFGNKMPFSTSDAVSYTMSPSQLQISQNALTMIPANYSQLPHIAARLSSQSQQKQ